VPEGYKLVGADASGLELRMLSHHLHKYDGGKYGQLVLNGDIHTHNQESAGIATRDQAKTFIYAWLYGSGVKNLGELLGGSTRDGRDAQRRFLQANPEIARLKDSLIAEYKENNGWLDSLDGVPIWNPSDHTALNTKLQSSGAIVMKRAAVIFRERLEDSGLKQYVKIVGNIHDELQVEVFDKDQMPAAIGVAMKMSIKEAGEYYNLNIPLDGEYKVGDNWSKTH